MKALSHLEMALKRRKGLSAEAYRLFCGEKEGIPGFVADRLGKVIVFQVHEGKCELDDRDLPEAARWYLSCLPAQSVYLKRFVPDRSQKLAEDVLYSKEPLAGTAALEKEEIRENGTRLWIRPYDGFSTGIFLDQRENRKFLAERSKGRRVLNCFAYTCAFSISCAKEGASVTSVDVSRRYLEWGKENFLLNDLPLEAHRFLKEDALRYLKKAAKDPYDLIILDPPSFSRSHQGDVFSVQKDVPRLLELAKQAVKPGGSVFFSTNFAAWDSAKVEKLAREAWPEAEKIKLPPAPLDFSWEISPLKNVMAEF